MILRRRASRSSPPRPRRKREAGGLLIVLMVGVTVIFIGLSVAVQSWSVVWRRDSEDELIFRGGQYVDAILAYAKDHNGQYPTDLEILAKEGPRRVRYIRKLFRDPINPTGQWGLLYLMPGGNAIYDPVAAQRGKGTDGSVSDAAGAMTGGVTPIGDQFGTGVGGMQPGTTSIAVPGSGGMGGGGGQILTGKVGAQPGITNTAARMAQQGGFRGSAIPGLGGGFSGGALPPPKPATGTFDEHSPSEPPIGWPIVGVISRAPARYTEKTFKVYKGHDKIDQWQFHAFDQTLQVALPAGMPGGSMAPFGTVGPGFGGPGRGKIWGAGGGFGSGNQKFGAYGSSGGPQQNNGQVPPGGKEKPKGGG